MKGAAKTLKAHKSSEEFHLTLHLGKRQVPLKIWLEAESFVAMSGASPGVATFHFALGGKKGAVQMPLRRAHHLMITMRRCCANVISVQYGERRSQAAKKGK